MEKVRRRRRRGSWLLSASPAAGTTTQCRVAIPATKSPRLHAVGSDHERVSIREATEEDVACFGAFFQAAWKKAGPAAPGFTGATEEVIAELTAPEAFAERVGGPDRRMFLAWADGRVVGFSSTRTASDDSVELSGIIVLDSHSGLGIGTALVEEAMAAARVDGHRLVIVKTETTNTRATRFYESRGFTAVGTEIEHVDDVDVQVVRLQRAL